jgi:hypothetical protein
MPEIEEILEFIENAPLPIPIDRFFDENGNHITKREYGHILLETLCVELRKKYVK